jgi:hypothetical protein
MPFYCKNTFNNRPRVTFFIQKCYKMHCGVRLHGQDACYVIFWNIAPKHWIYMDTRYCNSFSFSLWLYNYWEYVIYSNCNYQNLPGKMCRIEKNTIMISPYPIFEVNKLPHDEIFYHVTTDPEWHFSYKNVTKCIVVSDYMVKMHVM